MMRSLLVAAILFGSAAGAQSLTAEQIQDMVDQKLGGQNEYQALLSDPDGQRSRAAMGIMMASGDPELVRMALDFGLTSTDRVVRRMALEGFFSGAPALHVTFDGSGVENLEGYKGDLRQLQGSVADDLTGFALLKLGEWSPENACWFWSDNRTCGVRLTDAGSSIFFQGYWYPMALEDGVLRGVSTMHYTQEPVSFGIPVAP